MTKLLAFGVSALSILGSAHAQQSETVSSLGVKVGLSTYYGELNDRIFPATSESRRLFNNIDYASWGLDYEQYFGNAWGAGILYTNSEFSASDRRIKWNGDLITDAENFARGLNVRTKINDLSVYGIWSANDGKLISETSWLAPYFKFGVGLTKFDTYGDLTYQGDGTYAYAADGSISATPAGSDAPVVLDELDGTFETPLRELGTNGSEYGKYTYSVLGGFGLNFRLGEHFSLQAETNVRYTGTDNLDDVSGPVRADLGSELANYANNPSGNANLSRGESGNDWYAFTNLTARFYFGDRSEQFVAPRVIIGELSPYDTAVEQSGPFQFAAQAKLTPLTPDSLTRAPALVSAEKLELPGIPGISFTQPEEVDSTQVDAEGRVPSIEDGASVDYMRDIALSEPVVDTSSSSDTASTIPNIVSTYPTWTEEEIRISDSLMRAVDGLDPALTAADGETVDSTTVAQIDSLESIDSLQVASIDSLEQTLDSLGAETLASVDSTELQNTVSQRSAAAKTAELAAVRSQLDSLQRIRQVNSAVRDSLNARDRRTRRVAAAQRERVAQSTPRTDNRTASQPPQQDATQQQLAALQAQIAALQASTAARPAQPAQGQPAPAPAQPQTSRMVVAPVPVPAPTRAAKPDTSAAGQQVQTLLTEVETLRQQIARLQQSSTPNAVAPQLPPPAPNDPRVAAFNSIANTSVTRIFFEFNSATLSTGSLNGLNSIAQTAQRNPAYVQIQLEGFTDRTGSQAVNQRLAERRVRAVRNALESLGVKPAQIAVSAVGEDFDAGDLAFGRRVEVRLTVR